MEHIIDKLNKLDDQDTKRPWRNWSLEEMKQLLEIYFIISKNEAHIFQLIYSNHGCDSWEDIFRDYDKRYLEDKATGVKIAIDELSNEIASMQHKIHSK